MTNVFAVAKNEVSLLAKNPIVLLFMGIMFLLAAMNAAGIYQSLASSVTVDSYAAFLMWNMQQNFGNITTFLVFLSVCVGVLSIADERSSSSLRVLIAKPLYRRDIILGKFVGLGGIFLFLVTFTVLMYMLLAIMAVNALGPMMDIVLKIGSFAFVLFVYCLLNLGLIMLFGILFSKIEALILSFVFIVYELVPMVQMTLPLLGDLQFIDPQNLYYAIFLNQISPLFSTSTAFSSWTSYALPFIVLMLAEVVIVLLANCILFNREEA